MYVVSVDAHALGKDVAYNAMERLWPQASAIHPSTPVNFMKAKAGEGSCVASLPEIGAAGTRPLWRRNMTSGGSCMASLPEIGLQEHDHCGAGT